MLELLEKYLAKLISKIKIHAKTMHIKPFIANSHSRNKIHAIFKHKKNILTTLI